MTVRAPRRRGRGSAGFILALVLLGGTLMFHGRAFLGWVLPALIGLGIWWGRVDALPVMWWITTLLFGALVLLFGLPSLRRALVTRHVLRAMAPIFPSMSATERTALEAGTVSALGAGHETETRNVGERSQPDWAASAEP